MSSYKNRLKKGYFMKKLIIVFILICSLNYLTFAFNIFEESEGDENDNLTGNFGIGFFFPLDRSANVGSNILGSLLLSSISGGLGYHFNIIKNFLSPGIYGDIHFSLLSLLNSTNDDKDKEENKTEEVFIFFQAGIRLYNQFRLILFDIQPFIGINFALANNISSLSKMFGILIAYENIGIEYSYHWTLLNSDNVHRIIFVIHMK